MFDPKTVPHRQNVKRKSERGQGFVELALTLLFLLILFSAMVDLSWSFYTLITLRDATQEAAAYGSVCPVLADGTTKNYDLIFRRLLGSTTAPIDVKDIKPENVQITFHQNDASHTETQTPVMGGSIKVRVTVQHNIVTPFIGAVIGTQSYPLTVEVADTVMRSAWLKQCE